MNKTVYVHKQHLQAVHKKKLKCRKLLFFAALVFLAVFLIHKLPDSASVKNKSVEIIPVKHKSAYMPKSKLKDTKSKWYLLLVNPWNPVPDNLSIDLVRLRNGLSVDKRIYPELQAMLDDARAAGLSPVICSAYRTAEKQARLFKALVGKYISDGYSESQAEALAKKHIAAPGTSEHQTGLAVDIVAKSNQLLNETQEKTAEQQWLIKNCYKYGFILRYPSNLKEITGVIYEPWHYRYVGKKAAEIIMKKGICLEQYPKNYS